MPLYINESDEAKEINKHIDIINEKISKILPCKTCIHLYCNGRLFNYVDVQVRKLNLCPCYIKSDKNYNNKEIKNIQQEKIIINGFLCFWLKIRKEEKINSIDDEAEIIRKMFTYDNNELNECITELKEYLRNKLV